MPISESWTLVESTTTLVIADDSPSAAIALTAEQLPRDLALDAFDDVAVIDGDLVLDSGLESIGSDVESWLRMFRGEWFLDTTAGIPYLTQPDGTPAILGKGLNLAAIRAVLDDGIRGRVGVREVTTLELAYDGTVRTLSITFRATTDYGELARTLELGAK